MGNSCAVAVECRLCIDGSGIECAGSKGQSDEVKLMVTLTSWPGAVEQESTTRLVVGTAS